eukprot:gene10168-18836_t
MEGMQVLHRIVQDVVKELDPGGCDLHQRKCLRRRKYRAVGPNYVWHLDGYDKIKQFGFQIHDCIDALIQVDLDHVKDHWNSHRIRNSGHSTVPGIPDELCYLPGGGED